MDDLSYGDYKVQNNSPKQEVEHQIEQIGAALENLLTVTQRWEGKGVSMPDCDREAVAVALAEIGDVLFAGAPENEALPPVLQLLNVGVEAILVTRSDVEGTIDASDEKWNLLEKLRELLKTGVDILNPPQVAQEAARGR